LASAFSDKADLSYNKILLTTDDYRIPVLVQEFCIAIEPVDFIQRSFKFQGFTYRNPE